MKWSSLSLPALSGWCLLALKDHSVYKQVFIRLEMKVGHTES